MTWNAVAGSDPYSSEIPWGTHFCQFYRTKEDLAGSVLPFFKEGLARNERCIWVTSELLPAHEAEAMLTAAVPDIESARRRQQVEVVTSDVWYGAARGAEDLTKRWIEREQDATAAGFAGIRVVENPLCREEGAWQAFIEYEARLNHAFVSRKIIGLCSHRIDQCTSMQVIDVLRNHHYTLVKENGAWDLLENPARRPACEAASSKDGLAAARLIGERTAELEAALEARDGFLNLAAHELKTPITALQLYVDGLLRALRKRALPPDEVQARIHKVREQSVRLDRLVSSLLDVSRASSKPLAIYPEEVDLTELSLTVIERFREEAARSSCPLDFRTGGPVFGHWDRARLEQALGNLLSNAIKYAPGGPIRVSVMQDGPLALLSVTDHGSGVAEADRARIFERFTRLGRGPYQSGFGLGLWIAQQIAQRHGGTLSVSGEPGAGATFTMVLPRRPEETEV